MKNLINTGYRPVHSPFTGERRGENFIAEGHDWVERLSISNFTRRVTLREIKTHSLLTLYRFHRRARKLEDGLTFFHVDYPLLSAIMRRIEHEITVLERTNVGDKV